MKQPISDETAQLDKNYHGKNLDKILGSNIPNLPRVLCAGEPRLLLNLNLGQ